MLMSTFVFADENFLDNDEGVILFEDEESVSILEDVGYFVDGVEQWVTDLSSDRPTTYASWQSQDETASDGAS